MAMNDETLFPLPSRKLLPEYIGYIAGLFDGEGSVSISQFANGNARLGCRIKMASLWGILQVQGCFPGKLTLLPPGRERRIPTVFLQWALNGQACVPFLEAVKPLCIVKRPEIDAALEIASLKRAHRPGKPHTQWAYRRFTSLYQEATKDRYAIDMDLLINILDGLGDDNASRLRSQAARCRQVVATAGAA